MANPYFAFKQFTIYHHRCAMKVTTDSCLFGAWVANELRDIKKPNSTVLDIGTGSGLLAFMIAQKNEVHIDAIEIEKEAAQQASENVSSSVFENKIKIIQKDIANWIPEKKYDIIVSNPPFYEGDLVSPDAAKNKAHHSSALTLHQLLFYMHQHLAMEGAFFLLLPYHRLPEITKLITDLPLSFQQIITVKQTEKHTPFRILIKGSHVNDDRPTLKKELTIKCQDQYTKEFIALLQDYYLYL